MKNKKLFILLVLIMFLSLCLNNAYAVKTNKYEESKDSLNYNPERGFYRTATLKLNENDNVPLNLKSEISTLLWLRVDISSFSGAQNKEKDKELTTDAINALNKTLENIRNNNNSVILRFVYDKKGDGITNDEGKLDENDKRYVEPETDMIVNHIKSLKDTFNKYSDVIYDIQIGFFGDYGEMHGSSKCTTDNFNKVIDALLDNTGENISISVRTPNQLIAYANYIKEANIDINNIDIFKTSKEMKTYRLGIYDDGYLGSKSDLGTYRDRNKEISFLDKQNTHTTFGGEAVINYDDDAKLDGYKYMNKYSDIYNLEKEALKTHTDYLNYEWNGNLHSDWRKALYDGSNEFYKNIDGYTYYDFIESHLGYRYILRDSNIKNKDDSLQINLKIENEGFSNIKKEKLTELIVTDLNDNILLIKNTNFDIRNIFGGTINDANLNLDLNNKLKDGDYKLYIRVSSGSNKNGIYLPVEFANENIWNDNLKANLIDTFAYKRNVIKPGKKENSGKNEESKEENLNNKNSKNENSDGTNIENNKNETIIYDKASENVTKNSNVKTSSKEGVKSNIDNKEEIKKDDEDVEDTLDSLENDKNERKENKYSSDENYTNKFIYIMTALFIVLGFLIVMLIITDINS